MTEQGNQNIGYITPPQVRAPVQQNLIMQPAQNSQQTGYQPPPQQQTAQAYSYTPIVNTQIPQNVGNNQQLAYGAGNPMAPPPPPPPPIPPNYQGQVPQGIPAQGMPPNYMQPQRAGPGGMPYNPNSPMPRISVLSKCPACGFSGYTNVEFETGNCAIWCGVGLFCLTGIFCCWIPYVVDSFKDARHYCRSCNRQIGVMKQC